MIDYDRPIPCQFLLGTVQHIKASKDEKIIECQFLLGMVQQVILFCHNFILTVE